MIEINHTAFPVLVTERLVLRQLEIIDENEIFLLRSDELVNEFINRPRARSTDDAKDFINKIRANMTNNESFYWAITLKEKDKLIGTICYWNISKEKNTAEIGYELLPAFQGKGIMQEALVKVLEYGFHTMKLASVEAYMHPGNGRSSKLLQKNQFIRRPDLESANESGEIIYSLSK